MAGLPVIINKQIVRLAHLINKVIHGMQREILISAIAAPGWLLCAPVSE
jgi:hypothetical protein